AYGHKPCVLTNGLLFTPEFIDQMLKVGVREVSISVDAIEADAYRKIRRGGELSRVLEVCADLRARKKTYPDLVLNVVNVLFKNTFHRQEEFIRFWTGRADRIVFQAEYYNVFKFRNLLYDPGERTDCDIRVYLLPNGQMSPCCAITAYQHNRKVEWLPHIGVTSPEDALGYFKKLYADPHSPLGLLCRDCDWWKMFKRNEQGHSAFTKTVLLPSQIPGSSPAPPSIGERQGVFDLREAIPSDGAEVTGDGPVHIRTSPHQWAYAARVPIHAEAAGHEDSLTIWVDAAIEQGEIGIAVARAELDEFVTPERIGVASSGHTSFQITLKPVIPGSWLVVRNVASGNVSSRIRLDAIRVFGEHQIQESPPVSEFVPLESLAPALPSPAESNPRQEVWLDVGGHLGERTLKYAIDNSGIRVYAFEPQLDLACQLMGRLSNYIVLPMAVDERDGAADFHVNRCRAASSLLALVPEGVSRWQGGEDLDVEATTTVPTIRLDTFLNAADIGKVAYLKIDTQGNDLAVLRSLGGRLKDVARIDLEVQITPVPLYQNAAEKQEVIDFLTR